MLALRSLFLALTARVAFLFPQLSLCRYRRGTPRPRRGRAGSLSAGTIDLGRGVLKYLPVLVAVLSLLTWAQVPVWGVSQAAQSSSPRSHRENEGTAPTGVTSATQTAVDRKEASHPAPTMLPGWWSGTLQAERAAVDSSTALTSTNSLVAVGMMSSSGDDVGTGIGGTHLAMTPDEALPTFGDILDMFPVGPSLELVVDAPAGPSAIQSPQLRTRNSRHRPRPTSLPSRHRGRLR